MNTRSNFIEILKQEHAVGLEQVASSLVPFMKKAMDHFVEVGLPQKSSPGYGYFPLSRLLDNKLEGDGPVPTSVHDLVLPECLHSFLVIRNGTIDLALSDLSALPKGVVIEKLESAHSPYMPFVHAKLVMKQKEETDPFILLCQAHLRGALIIIPESTRFSAPLQIIFLQESGSVLPTFNNYLYVGSRAEVEIVLTASGKGSGQMASYLDMEVGDRAKVDLIRMSVGTPALMFEAMSIYLKKEAHLNLIDLAEPENSSRFNLHVIHEKEGALSRFFSLAMMRSKKEYHLKTLFEHRAKNTGSYQLVKTLLQSKAKASFEGQIYVHPGALWTQSYQKHATLMLGEQGISYSRPNLRIMADDVKASHGATISSLDEQALFYLKTRGIDMAGAKKMLSEGFCLDIIHNIQIDSIRHLALDMLERVQADVPSLLS